MGARRSYPKGKTAAAPRRRVAKHVEHQSLGTPAAILHQLDREIGAIFIERYPTRYADWFYLVAVRWLIVPLLGGAIIVAATTAFHAPRWVADIGLIALLLGMLGLAIGIVPAFMQQLWQGWRALADAEARGGLVAACETAAYGMLCETSVNARKLCRQRSIDRLGATHTIPTLCAAGFSLYITKGFQQLAPDRLLHFADTNREGVSWTVFILLAIVVFSLIAAGHLRRHIYLITVSLGEDPHKLKLARLPWIPKS